MIEHQIEIYSIYFEIGCYGSGLSDYNITQSTSLLYVFRHLSDFNLKYELKLFQLKSLFDAPIERIVLSIRL